MTVHSALDTGTFHRPYLFRISVVLMHIFSIAANMRFSGSIISVSVIRASVKSGAEHVGQQRPR